MVQRNCSATAQVCLWTGSLLSYRNRVADPLALSFLVPTSELGGGDNNPLTWASRPYAAVGADMEEEEDVGPRIPENFDPDADPAEEDGDLVGPAPPKPKRRKVDADVFLYDL